jgi:hypothetical protein
MITGAQFWNDRSRYYVQHNNPTEEILRKRSDGNWLVSCGPTAAVGCIAAMGHQVDITCPGVYKPQAEEVLMDFFNDPRNYEELEKARPETHPADWHGNEIPQFYPVAVSAVFGVAATFIWVSAMDKVALFLRQGKAVQLCLKQPGHYIAALAWDEEKREIIFNDPWPARFPEGNGFNRRMDEAEYRRNVKPFAVVYGGNI